MGIKVASGFDLNAPQLLDTKSVQATLEAMNQLITDNYAVEGQLCFCKADSLLYVLKNIDNTLTWVKVTDEVDEELAKEIAARTQADTDLQTAITTETTRATTRENELEEAIKVAGKIDDVTVNGTSVVEDKVAKIDLSEYAKSSDLDSYVLKAGDTMTGTLTTPAVNTASDTTKHILATGTNESSYFQTKKLRGQGDASTYNHAVDWGYAGHDRIDFYEYGGTFNFWANRGTTKLEGDANRVASLRSGKLIERGNTLTYPGKSGTIALTDDLTDFVDKSTAQTITGLKTFKDTGSGAIALNYNNGTYSTYLHPTAETQTANLDVRLQNKSGTLALVADVEDAKSEIADNYVTLATDQTITGQKYTTQRLVYRDSSQTTSLPSGYQPAAVTLAGIGVDTGIQVSSLTLPTIETTFKFGIYGDYDWFGTTDVSSPTIMFDVNSAVGTCYVSWGRTGSCDGQTLYASVANSTAFNTYLIQSVTTSQHEFFVNDNLVATEMHTASFTHTGNLLIGKGRTTPAATWKVFRLWDSGTLLFEGIGAYNESTKQYGFYDTVSGTFKTTSGAFGTIIGDEKYTIESEVPTNVSQLTNDAGYTTNKGTVTSVAVKMNGAIKGTVIESGTIDLGNVVTVAPTVNDGKLTIQAEGTTLGTFTANQSTSTTVNITAASLGLSGSMKFIGTTTTEIADGSTTNPITIKGASVTAIEGNVVIYNHKEFLWTNDAWEELGDESSYAYKSVTIKGAGVLEGGGDLTTNREITHAKITTEAKESILNPTKWGWNEIHSAITGATADGYGHITSYTKTYYKTPSLPTVGNAVTGITATASVPTFSGKEHAHSYDKTTSIAIKIADNATLNWSEDNRNVDISTTENWKYANIGYTSTSVSSTTAEGTITAPNITINDSGHTHTLSE